MTEANQINSINISESRRFALAQILYRLKNAI